MASGGKQRFAPKLEEEIQTKKPKLSTDAHTAQEVLKVQLNPADCNLDFDIEDDGLRGHALYDKGFAYCWSGARANLGIRGGKYCFSLKVTNTQPVEMEDTPPEQQHVCRVGVSRGDDNVGNLGETDHSFGFGGTGKFSSGGKFLDYGSKFSVGDTILCAVNLESRPLAEISFSKDRTHLGVAKRLDSGPNGMEVTDTVLKKLRWESAFFPHVLLKNVVVQMQFSIEDGLVPLEGYKPWSAALQDGNGVIGPQFNSVKECEVLMMVGLPAAGKSTWADNWVKTHPEKRYMVLGTNLALDQMKVPGLLRKQNYGERFDRLMDRATGIFNTLLARASKIPRNYILDQTNVYKSARKRKLRLFNNYRKIAVVIFPPPQELKIRAKKRFKEMGKEVPPEAVNEMLANYILPMSKDMPGSDEIFDEVWFPELKGEEALNILEMDKSELKAKSITKSRDVSNCSRAGSVASVTGPCAGSMSTDTGPHVGFTKLSHSGGSWRSSAVPSMDHNIYASPKVGGLQVTPDMLRGTPDMDSRGRFSMPSAPLYSRGTPDMMRGTPGMDSRARSSIPSASLYSRFGEVGDQKFPRMDMGGLRDQPYPEHRGLMDQPYPDSRGLMDQPYPDSRGFRDQPYLDHRSFSDQPYPESRGVRDQPYPDQRQRGFRDEPYPDQGGPYSVDTGPQFGRPQPYGMADPGRLQTRSSAPPGPYSMAPRSGWGHQPY